MNSLKPSSDGLFLYKLHGSIESDIIPPTWNKILHEEIKSDWEGAFNALSKANHIRILGYSLPSTDSYLKYLFKSAISKNDFLKSIDVICLDPTNTVEARYREFINFPKLNFTNTNLTKYLECFLSNLERDSFHNLVGKGYKNLNYAEGAHQKFLRS
jgi:hypothetical protein